MERGFLDGHHGHGPLDQVECGGFVTKAHTEHREIPQRAEIEITKAIADQLRAMVAGRRCGRTIHATGLVDRLRLWSAKNLLETWITSQRIPYWAQTKIRERDATRIIRPRDCAGSGKEALD